MKTTIKGTDYTQRQVVVQPAAFTDSVTLTVAPKNPCLESIGMSIVLTPDQVGVLIFALEQALEANEVKQLRKAA